MPTKAMEIKKSKRGPYYTLFIDGCFAGNFDTYGEAFLEYQEMDADENLENPSPNYI